ncbi:hypothetical protein D3C81_1823730 [compost metagenome]
MARGVAQPLGTVASAAVARVDIDRGRFVRRYRAAQGAALQQTRCGHLQIQIALGDLLDQRAEPGIVKGFPPPQLQRFGLRLACSGLALQACPLLRGLAGGALEVRPQGAACHEHGQQQRAQT